MATWQEVFENLKLAADDVNQDLTKGGSGAGLLAARFQTALNPFASDESKAFESEGALRGGRALEEALGEKGAVAAQVGSQALANALPLGYVASAAGKALGAGSKALAKSAPKAAETLKEGAGWFAADLANKAPREVDAAVEAFRVRAAKDPIDALARKRVYEQTKNLPSDVTPKKLRLDSNAGLNASMSEAERAAAVDKYINEMLDLEGLKPKVLPKTGAGASPIKPFDGSWR